MSPLQEATTDELLGELGRRYKAALFVAEKPTPGSDTEYTTCRWYTGGLNTALGMAIRAKNCLIAEMEHDEDDDDDEDNGR